VRERNHQGFIDLRNGWTKSRHKHINNKKENVVTIQKYQLMIGNGVHQVTKREVQVLVPEEFREPKEVNTWRVFLRDEQTLSFC